MKSNVISHDELNQFRAIPQKVKIDSMEVYLIGVNNVRYNMEETARMVFGKDNDSFTVSLIHRCYNFSGKNSGRYRNKCQFEQQYGYHVTRRDIEEFVRQYPDGTFNQGITFEDFLLGRLRSGLANAVRYGKQEYKNTAFPSQKERDADKREEKKTENSGDEDFVIVIGVIAVIILVILLFTGNLFKHWIISLILLFIAIGGLGSGLGTAE